MKSVGALLAATALLAVAPISSAVLSPDGIWSLHEQFCVSVNHKTQCGRGSEQLMFFDGEAYFDDGTGAGWTEIGTVTTSGRKLTVNVTREGVAALVGHRIGVDVTDLLQNFSFTYAGSLRGGKIVNGRARASIDIATEDMTYRIRLNGTFTGRRVGDAYPVPPPDSGSGAFVEAIGAPPSDSLETRRTTPSSGDGPSAGLLSAIAAAAHSGGESR
jgi:hypothetical protein